MENKENEEWRCDSRCKEAKLCEKCSPICRGQFLKVFDMPDSGFSIYKHLEENASEGQQQGNARNKTDQKGRETLLLHIYSDKPVDKIQYMVEFEEFGSQCDHCNLKLAQVRKLLETFKTLKPNDVMTTCPRCQAFKSHCKQCSRCINKFLMRRAKHFEESHERYQHVVADVKKLVSVMLQKETSSKTRTKSSIDELKNILQELQKPDTFRVPHIQDFPIDDIEAMKVIDAVGVVENKALIDRIITIIRSEKPISRQRIEKLLGADFVKELPAEILTSMGKLTKEKIANFLGTKLTNKLTNHLFRNVGQWCFETLSKSLAHDTLTDMTNNLLQNLDKMTKDKYDKLFGPEITSKLLDAIFAQAGENITKEKIEKIFGVGVPKDLFEQILKHFKTEKLTKKKLEHLLGNNSTALNALFNRAFNNVGKLTKAKLTRLMGPAFAKEMTNKMFSSVGKLDRDTFEKTFGSPIANIVTDKVISKFEEQLGKFNRASLRTLVGPAIADEMVENTLEIFGKEKITRALLEKSLGPSLAGEIVNKLFLMLKEQSLTKDTLEKIIGSHIPLRVIEKLLSYFEKGNLTPKALDTLIGFDLATQVTDKVLEFLLRGTGVENLLETTEKSSVNLLPTRSQIELEKIKAARDLKLQESAKQQKHRLEHIDLKDIQKAGPKSPRVIQVKVKLQNATHAQGKKAVRRRLPSPEKKKKMIEHKKIPEQNKMLEDKKHHTSIKTHGSKSTAQLQGSISSTAGVKSKKSSTSKLGSRSVDKLREKDLDLKGKKSIKEMVSPGTSDLEIKKSGKDLKDDSSRELDRLQKYSESYLQSLLKSAVELKEQSLHDSREKTASDDDALRAHDTKRVHPHKDDAHKEKHKKHTLLKVHIHEEQKKVPPKDAKQAPLKETKERPKKPPQKQTSTKKLPTQSTILLKMLLGNLKKKANERKDQKQKPNEDKTLLKKMNLHLPEIPKTQKKYRGSGDESRSTIVCEFGPEEVDEMIQGEAVVPMTHRAKKKDGSKIPLLFETETFLSDPVELENKEPVSLPKVPNEFKPSVSKNRGIIRYSLSNPEFIDKGWTKLPATKTMRKMNIYKMSPTSSTNDWFEKRKIENTLYYDTDEKLAEIDPNGCGRWYYKNGLLALDYYMPKEPEVDRRYVLYSSGERDVNGNPRPVTILGYFDSLGNGVIYDHYGNERLKYNQSEGAVYDERIAPPGKWLWHGLNEPPEYDTVYIENYHSGQRHYGSCAELSAQELNDGNENTSPNVKNKSRKRPSHSSACEEMLAIELQNFVKQRAKKLLQSFKPFAIKPKFVKINENFAIKIINQSNINLEFRDGVTVLKQNIGMILINNEIVGFETVPVGIVATPFDRVVPKSGSMENLALIVDMIKKKSKKPEFVPSF